MSYRRRGGFIMVSALVGGGALAAADTLPLQPALKMHSELRIKPGLWEFSDTAKVAGDTVFPDAVVARVPAAQRAQHLAELRRMISQPSKERECINQAIFEQRIFGIETSCKRTIVSNTAGRLEIGTECRSESGGLKQYKIAKVLATSAASVISSFHAVSTRAGKTMTVDSVENGRWIGSNCGSVRGIQQL